MKRLPVLAVFVAGLFLSCSFDFDDIPYTITNNMGQQITVSFNGDSIIIPDGETISRTVSSRQGTQSPRIMAPPMHPRKIQIEQRGSSTRGLDYTFSPASLGDLPIPLYVTNNLPTEAIVRAGNFLAEEYPFTTYLRQIGIYPGDTYDQIFIFTRTPTFTIHRRISSNPARYVPLNVLPGSGNRTTVVWGIRDGAMHVYLTIIN